MHTIIIWTFDLIFSLIWKQFEKTQVLRLDAQTLRLLNESSTKCLEVDSTRRVSPYLDSLIVIKYWKMAILKYRKIKKY